MTEWNKAIVPHMGNGHMLGYVTKITPAYLVAATPQAWKEYPVS